METHKQYTYIASKLYKKSQSGISIPLTILFTLIGSAYLFSYTSYIYDKDWQVEHSIAKTKAEYNADAGIALDAYTVLFRIKCKYYIIKTLHKNSLNVY